MAEDAAPNQHRKFPFPARFFGNRGEKRFFKCAWFDERPWLDYNESNDSVTCFYCSCANEKNLLPKSFASKREESFISKGFKNWKDGCSGFW